MTESDKLNRAETHVVKAVFPNTTNHYDTLFGGQAVEWMDEVAFVTGTRYCRQRLVTVSIDRIDFTKPIPAGTIVELVGTVVRVGKTSLQVKVEVFMEQMYSESREKAIEGSFTMVAVDENKKPIKVTK
ncbi:MAG TPA: acyl-CoA thioesterase [candidate division Zixibacteria bacterium]|nr:acyl-CoA thioesterase [candidate division Zixibacteria bacterium]